MINVTTAEFLADAEGYLDRAHRGEPIRIARPGRGALVLLCGGAYEQLDASGVVLYGPGENPPGSINGLRAVLRELDNPET